MGAILLKPVGTVVVAVESPGFYAALQAIERLDLRAVEIPVDPASGLDLAALEEALAHVMASGDVWPATAAEILDVFRTQE